jgi:hypothetical protein
MKAFSRTHAASRRAPVSRDRYRAVARGAGVAARLRRRALLLDGAFLVLAILFVILATPRVTGAVGTGFDDLGSKLGEMLPALQGTKAIELPSGGGTVNVDLIAQGIPDFTREPQLKLAGRIPEFAMAAGRKLEITLNGTVVFSKEPDAGGAFDATVTLREGPNAMALTLLSGIDIVAHSSYTVVLDRQPPPLTLTKPASGATIEGTNVVIEGKSEAGATIAVDGRTVIPAQDGSFSDSYTVIPGAMTITVIARDRAGNETTVKTPITVKAAANATLAVSVTLDKVKVTPGAIVTAQVQVTANGLPKADEQVTLSVGVITIGSAKTNAAGIAFIGFAAPPNEGDAAVVVLATGASGRATLTVAK